MTLYTVNYRTSNIQTFRMHDRTNKKSSAVRHSEEKVMKNENIAPSVGKNPEEVEDLTYNFKENLRVSTFPGKSRTLISRKSSRASPYHVPARCNSLCNKPCYNCDTRHSRRSRLSSNTEEDPFEFLQKLLQNGNLVAEAVKRLNENKELPPKQRFFYESDDEYETTCGRLNNSQGLNLSQNSEVGYVN